MSWDVVYQQEWFTPDVSCRAAGRGDGPETEGLAILARRPISSPGMTALPDSRIGFETFVRDTGNLPVIVTHLTSGASSGATRSQQLDRLLSWSAGFGEPRILIGDFNARPEDPEVQRIFATYHDAWNDAVKLGDAAGSGLSDGATRIDYIFFLPGSTLTLQSAEAIDTTALFGVAASDHSPLVATFTAR